MEIKKEFFEKLLECKWLENCGSEIGTDYDFATMLVSKKEAEKRIASIKWQNTCLDARNELTEYLFFNHRDEYNQMWNPQVMKIREEYYPQIEPRIKAKAEELGLSEKVCDDVKFIFIIIMMNHFFSEYYEVDFTNRLLAVYLSGHIPCGITGNRETGTIMIY